MKELCDEHVKEYYSGAAVKLRTYVDNFEAWGTRHTVGSVIPIHQIFADDYVAYRDACKTGDNEALIQEISKRYHETNVAPISWAMKSFFEEQQANL